MRSHKNCSKFEGTGRADKIKISESVNADNSDHVVTITGVIIKKLGSLIR